MINSSSFTFITKQSGTTKMLMGREGKHMVAEQFPIYKLLILIIYTVLLQRNRM